MNAARPNDERSSILVVEDEFLVAMEMEAALISHGYVVLGPVATVPDALELLKRERPDAAVLDINLRGVAVTPVARTLREMNIPFVIASAYTASDFPPDDVLRQAVNVGKPILIPAFLGVPRAAGRLSRLTSLFSLVNGATPVGAGVAPCGLAAPSIAR